MWDDRAYRVYRACRAYGVYGAYPPDVGSSAWGMIAFRACRVEG